MKAVETRQRMLRWSRFAFLGREESTCSSTSQPQSRVRELKVTRELQCRNAFPHTHRYSNSSHQKEDNLQEIPTTGLEKLWYYPLLQRRHHHSNVWSTSSSPDGGSARR